MGYTHYWKRPPLLRSAPFASAAADCAAALAHLAAPLAGADGTGKPLFESSAITFNGVGHDSCETFAVALEEMAEDTDMVCSFCKTARLPYDIAVQIALIILQHHLGETFRVGSDGDEADWAIARQLCQQELGYGAAFKLDRT